MSDDRRTQPKPHWATQDDLHREIVGLERRFEKRFDEFSRSVSNAINEVKQGITTAIEKSSRPTNWGWVFAGVAALGSFVLLYVQPVRDSGDRRDLQISRLRDTLTVELNDRARWMGGADRDIAENSHELDLLWAWRHDKADPAVFRHDERIRYLEHRIDQIEQEQRKRTDRVYGGTP